MHRDDLESVQRKKFDERISQAYKNVSTSTTATLVSKEGCGHKGFSNVLYASICSITMCRRCCLNSHHNTVTSFWRRISKASTALTVLPDAKFGTLRARRISCEPFLPRIVPLPIGHFSAVKLIELVWPSGSLVLNREPAAS